MNPKFLVYLSRSLFLSRWLQAPLYFGLIVILGAYAYRFIAELFTLVSHMPSLSDSQVMLGVLDLIDVVMIANLLIMVIVGGYENFVSRLHLQQHPDKPEWLEEMNAGAMKVKLALALVGISSIHLLRTFIDLSKHTNFSVMWQVIIHITLVSSAIAIAFSTKLVAGSHKSNQLALNQHNPRMEKPEVLNGKAEQLYAD